MSMLGKIVAFLNVLAAIAFLYLAGTTLSTRQNYAYQIFRTNLLVHGLPLDAADESWRLPEQAVAADLGPETLKEVFAAARGGDLGGDPVATQEDEIRRVQGVLQAKIDALPEGQKRTQLLELLLLQARNAEERAALIRRRAAAPLPTEEADLQAQLNARFAAALAPAIATTPTADIQKDADDARRRTIASLLYNLSSETAWRERVQMVVGMNHFQKAAATQAVAVEEMVRQAQLVLAQDRSNFEADYYRTVQWLRTLTERNDTVRTDLQFQKDLAARHQTLIEARQKDIKDIQAAIARTNAAVQKGLENQEGLEAELFQMQRRLGQATEQNQQLEREIRALEGVR